MIITKVIIQTLNAKVVKILQLNAITRQNTTSSDQPMSWKTDFTILRTVPGEKPYSNAVKTRHNSNIKIFNITKGIRMRDFKKFVRLGKATCFPGATSNQFLHYLDVNLLDKNAELVILHI